MRAKFGSRGSRVAKITAGALLVGVPSALAATAPTGAASPVPAKVSHAQADREKSASNATPRPSAQVRFKLNGHTSAAVTGQRVRITGWVVSIKPRPGSATSAAVIARQTTHHTRVKLQSLVDGHWRLAAHSRTNGNGGFSFSFKVRRRGPVRLRLRYVPNRYAPSKIAPDGHITALTPTVASWYYDAGDTACGFHATYGVANKTLACGTHVTIEYDGHSVVATVDDRGPYVAGRDYDLNQNTAQRLGMEGVGTVYASRL